MTSNIVSREATSGLPPGTGTSLPVSTWGGSARFTVRARMSSRRACWSVPSGSISPGPSMTFTRSQL